MSTPFPRPSRPTLAVVTPGWVVPWHDAATHSRVAATERVSLLAMRVTSRLPRAAEPRFAFGLGLMPLDDDAFAVTLRLQLDAHQFFWLGHPEDPGLWGLLDEWRAAGRSAFMLIEGQAIAAFALSYDTIDQELRMRYRSNPTFDAGHFADAAFRLVVSGGLAQQATSDLADFSELENVDVTVLATDAVRKARPLVVAMPEAALPH